MLRCGIHAVTVFGSNANSTNFSENCNELMKDVVSSENLEIEITIASFLTVNKQMSSISNFE